MLIAKTDKLLPLVSLSQDKSSGNNIPMITELGKNRWRNRTTPSSVCRSLPSTSSLCLLLSSVCKEGFWMVPCTAPVCFCDVVADQPNDLLNQTLIKLVSELFTQEEKIYHFFPLTCLLEVEHKRRYFDMRANEE